MKTMLRYLHNSKGKAEAVQLPVVEWERIMQKIDKYEQLLMIKKDLSTAYNEVAKMQQGKIKKQSLQDFLNEL